MELSSTLKEKIKAAMVKRYNANLKALDLSRFHTDPGERMVVCNTHRMLIRIICSVIYLNKNSG
jgi:PIN domain nuclease of toxin-antitoxin system